LAEYAPGGINEHSRPLDVAWTQLGVYEQGGSNRGPQVDAFIKFAGHDPAGDVPWCAAFVVWSLHRAGYRFLVTAAVAALWRWAQSMGMVVPLEEIQPGDVLVRVKFVGGKSRSHCGFATRSRTAGDVFSIEGNTSKKNDRNGGRVMERKRGPSYWTGAFRPRKQEAVA
jgi:hypothetical protein